ncbi:MAG: UDP-N-acetylmuramoyl-L-alanyl-D-glutamate--2,6-diaminopimelate ligase [Myxococcota bacterium]
MQLGQLLGCVTQPLQMVRGSRACLRNPVLGVTQDSRRVGPGWIFVACPGATKHSHDGHAFVRQACEKQAMAVLVSDAKRVVKGEKTPVFVVANSCLALAQLAEAWHGHPSKQMQVCAVTGTNGKTSVTHLLATILQTAGYQAAVLGTLGVGKTGHLQSTLYTTSTAEDLSAQLAVLYQQGYTHVCMEMSSHALALERAHGTTLALGALTNITRDHLDFHGSMRQYIQAKKRLFQELLAAGQPAVLPVNHSFVQQAKQRGLRVVTWGQGVQAHVWASDVDCNSEDIFLRLHVNHKTFDVRSALWGKLHVGNMLCAAACAWALGVQEHVIAQGLCRAQPLPGRMQIVRVRGNHALQAPTVLVDYAHTPHALSCVLDAALQALPKQGRLILVFGCGGQRDPIKRPIMGAIAGQKAHLTVLTHDNPRHEEPWSILQNIASGIANRSRYHVVGDRAQAIEKAIAMAHPEDIVVIAGKGHEQTQQWGDEAKPFCDVAQAQQALQKHFGS